VVECQASAVADVIGWLPCSSGVDNEGNDSTSVFALCWGTLRGKAGAKSYDIFVFAHRPTELILMNAQSLLELDRELESGTLPESYQCHSCEQEIHWSTVTSIGTELTIPEIRRCIEKRKCATC
jgi:hypothetical protein